MKENSNSKSLMGLIVKRCPKSGKIVGIKSGLVYRILFPVIGLVAILWFLFRVLPKPSRAAYPCQQVAAGIGGTFLLYLFGAIGSAALFQQIKNKVNRPVALLYLAGVFLVATLGIGIAQIADPGFVPNITPPEGVNKPMGEGRGIFPGRVAWTQDFEATSWDGETGNWWDDASTNQTECDKMMSATLQNLAGKKSDKEAWDALFSWHNRVNGNGDHGYQKGEKIVIKLNMNANGKLTDRWSDKGYPSPHMLNSLLHQLIDVVGVAGEDIVLTDPSRYLGSPIVDKVRGNASPEFAKIGIEEKTVNELYGSKESKPDNDNPVWFTMPDGSRYKMLLPKSFSEATYQINYSLVRPHRVFGITSVAKNHFGSVWCPDSAAFKPNPLHAFAQWNYPTPNKLGSAHSAPVLLGHKTNFGKTVLYLADGLYTSLNQGYKVIRWSTLNGDWFSSLLLSQDPVALESVVYDFIVSEPDLISKNPSFNGDQDNQFQECALANNPPSGTFYDPENDGTRLQSLGVHEHWNNPVDKRYSRNLGKKNGIELVSSTFK